LRIATTTPLEARGVPCDRDSRRSTVAILGRGPRFRLRHCLRRVRSAMLLAAQVTCSTIRTTMANPRRSRVPPTRLPRLKSSNWRTAASASSFEFDDGDTEVAEATSKENAEFCADNRVGAELPAGAHPFLLSGDKVPYYYEKEARKRAVQEKSTQDASTAGRINCGREAQARRAGIARPSAEGAAG
jgi:hypothetical protein